MHTPAPTLDPVSLDGRRRRSQDSRARIVGALLELVREGNPSPSAEAVATRAKVGLRSVFRHFDDMDSLYREMTAVIEAELMSLIANSLQGETWRERLLALVDRRSNAFEAVAPFRSASDLLRQRSPFLQEAHARMNGFLRAVLVNVLPDELAADPLRLEALDMAMSFEAWRRLRADQGLELEPARETVRALVTSLTAA